MSRSTDAGSPVWAVALFPGSGMVFPVRADPRRWANVALIASALACGDPGRGPGLPAGSSGQQITIVDHQPLPARLAVAPGSTVLVRNEDPFAHSVTSEAAPGAQVPGGVQGIAFDTGPFTGTSAFAIPAAAAPGTVIPYFCAVHGGAPEGAVVVAAP